METNQPPLRSATPPTEGTRRTLPQQLQPELDLTRSSRTGNLAEERALHTQIRLSELSVIEGIVELSPKLKFEALGKLSVFEQ